MLLAIGLGALALAAFPGSGTAAAEPSCPSGQPCLIVHFAGSVDGTDVVSGAELTSWADITADDYPVRNMPGGPTVGSVSFGSGLSIRALITHLGAEDGGLSPDDVQLATVSDPRHFYRSSLQPPAFAPAGSNGFADSKVPAFFLQGDPATMNYTRPLTADPQDTNSDDQLTSVNNGPLVLTLSTSGTVLHPTIAASSPTTPVDKTVTFTSQVDGAPAGSTYTWDYSDGTDRDDSAVGLTTTSHSWTSSGSYYVTLVINSPDGSAGVSNQVKLTVSGPSPSPSQSPSPSHSPSPSQSPTTPSDPSDPPSSSGAPVSSSPGGTSPSSDAPTVGPNSGSTGNHVGGSVDPTANSTAGSGDGAAAQTGTATPSASPSPGAGPTAGPGEVVGILLAGATVPESDPAGGSPLTAPSARRTDAGAADRPFRVDPRVWLALGGVLLLGLGGVSETPWAARVRRRAGRWWAERAAAGR